MNNTSYAESRLLVRPEHLNHHGFLFGGRLLEWLDEQAYIALISGMKEDVNLVTVAIDQVEFRHQVRTGAVLRFRSMVVHVGRTSATVYTYVEKLHTAVAPKAKPVKIFRAYVTFVALDGQGKPCAIEPLLLEPFAVEGEERQRHWENVEKARGLRRGRNRDGGAATSKRMKKAK